MFASDFSRSAQISYEIYTRDAVFHDPIGIARGIDAICAQFDTLPKVPIYAFQVHYTSLTPLIALPTLRYSKASSPQESAGYSS